MSEPLPSVSVVIPTHNRSRRVEHAIDSALRQDHAPLEVLVVDDASTDDTAEVVARFNDQRVVYIRHHGQRGGSAARNSGIRAARADYIALLDDDDEWMPHYLRTQLQRIGSHDVILSNAIKKTNGKLDGRYNKTTITLRDLKRGFIFGAGASTIIARASLLKETLFDEELPCKQDWDLMVRLAAKGSIRYSVEPLVVFDNGSHDRITNANRRRKEDAELEKQLTAYYKHRDYLGPFWFRYQLARSLINFRASGNRRFGSFANIVRRCGVLPPIVVLYGRLKHRVGRALP